MTGKVTIYYAAGRKGGDKRYQEAAKYQNTFGPKIANGMPIHEQLLQSVPCMGSQRAFQL